GGVRAPVEDAQAPAAGRGWSIFRLLTLGMRRDRRKQERGAEDAGEGQRRRAENGHVVAVVRGEIARDAGSDEKADPESDADDGERAGALFGRGHVGDVRLRDGEVPGRQAVDDAREEDE